MTGHGSHLASSASGTDTSEDLVIPPRRRWRVPVSLLLVIAGAWTLAVVAELTGRADLVHHHEVVGSPLPVAATLALFFVAWQAHIAAMMLPASLPLINLFGRAAATQPRPHAARAAFLGGYLLIWTLFGLAALGGDTILHLAVDRWTWLADRSHLIGGGVLILAGAFQFTDLKDRCLQQCRHPALFLTAHYERGVGAAFALGRRHGLFCLGCCWALMLVMFSVGIANLTWMAPLALVMVIEKVAPRGDEVARMVGIGLLALGALVLVEPALLPELLGPHSH